MKTWYVLKCTEKKVGLANIKEIYLLLSVRESCTLDIPVCILTLHAYCTGLCCTALYYNPNALNCAGAHLKSLNYKFANVIKLSIFCTAL